MFASNRFTRRIGATTGMVCAAVTAISLPGTSALAQDDDDGALDEIVVTSRYREERLQQTPIAITAMSGVELEARALNAAYEVGYMVPNASLRPAQAAFGNTMSAFIRGIGQYDFNFAFEPGVGIYIDDVYHPFTMGSQIDLLDLERVEVLRGPQGTLFGRGAIGGAIRYVTQKPQGDGSGSIGITTGKFDRIDVRGSYDFALTDNLFARVAGVAKSRDGYQDRIDFACAFPQLAGNLTPFSPNRGRGCFIGTLGGEDVTGGRAALRWVLSDDLEFSATAEFLDDKSEARADTIINAATIAGDDLWENFYLLPRIGIPYDSRFVPPDIYTSYATFGDPRTGLQFDPLTSLEKSAVSASVDWAINDAVSMKAIFSHTEIESYFATDADGSPINVQTVDGFQDIVADTLELRFSGRAMDSVDWTLGAFFYDGTADSRQTVSFPYLTYLLDIFLPNAIGPSILLGDITFEEGADLLDSDPSTYTFVKSKNDHENEHQSIFGHFVWDLSDEWSLNAGFRYSEDEKRVAFDNTRVVNPLVVVEDDRTDWKLGVDYRVSDEVMFFASAASGYRPGSYNPRPFQATQVVAVDAEAAISYDIGMKADLLDNTLRLNVAAFAFDYETRILPVGGTECLLLDIGPPPVYQTADPSDPGAVQDTAGRTCFTTVPATNYENGPADITGLEAEFTYRPTDAFTLNGQIGTLEWDSPDINDNPASINDQPVYVPDMNWSLSANYRFDLAGGGSITPRIDVYGQSEICTTQTTDAGCAGAYELINAAIGWDSPDAEWNITLGATNLSDEEYFLNIFDLTAFGQPTTEGQPGRPQEWYLTLRRNFQ